MAHRVTIGFIRSAAAAFLVALAVLPVLLLLFWSLSGRWLWPELLPESWSLRAWAYVGSPAAEVLPALLASLGIALAVTLLAVLVALPAGRALALDEFPWKRQVLFLLLMPVLASPLAATMGVHSLFIRYGLTDSVLGVTLVHLIPAVPYATLMIMGAFTRLDPALEDQARTLGATPAAVWWRITLPVIAPGLAVAAAFAFLTSWSQYLTTLFIGGGAIQTLPLILVAFQRSGDEAVTAALSLVFLAPLTVVIATVARFLRTNP